MSKKYKYFAVDNFSSEFYFTKKEMFNDLKNFGDDKIDLYTLKFVDDVQDLTSEDLIGYCENGKLWLKK